MPKNQVKRRIAETAEPSRLSVIAPFLALLAVTLLVYGNTLANGFVHDDKPLVAENRLLRDPGDFARIFTSGYWTTRDASVPELYRPLAVTSFALNYLIGGPGPLSFHLVNLLLHAWVSWLVFRVGMDLSGSAVTGFAAGLLFAIHPVHSEAVAPVVGRSELLSAGFALGALLLHRRAGATGFRRLRLVTAAAACYFASTLSKENGLVLPAILLLVDAALPGSPQGPGEKRRWLGAYSLYFLTALLYLALRVCVLGAVVRSDIRPLDNSLISADPVITRLTALITAGKYVGLLFWPVHLSADYSGDQIPLASGWTDPRLAGSILALLAAAVLAAWGWRRWRLAFVSVLFYAVAILPVSNLLFPIGTIFGERLLYLPSVGFCLLAGALFTMLLRKRRLVALTVAGILLLAGSARTMARNRIWHDDATFAMATARDAPRNAKAQFNLGVFLEEHGDLQGAEIAYARSEPLAPEWGDPPYNRGGVLLRLRRPEEAVTEFRRAVELAPGQTRYRINLGVALNLAGRHEEAVDLYQGMIHGGDGSADAWNNLGVNLLALRRFPEAAEAFRKALGLDPGSGSYHANLAQATEAAGDLAAAESEYRAALVAAPDSAPLLRSLGLLLARGRKREEAAALLRRADSLVPGGLDPEARSVLQSLP
jgi:tetratricopeptide (TPR) repeat protein